MISKTILRSLVAVLSATAPLTGYSDHDHHGDHGHFDGGHFNGGHFYGGRFYGGGFYGGPFYSGYYSPYYYDRPYYWGPGFGFSYYSRPPYVYRGYVDDYRGGSLDAEVQAALHRRGYYHGPIDGSIGPASRAAIRAFQAKRGLYITGRIDRPLIHELGIY